MRPQPTLAAPSHGRTPPSVNSNIRELSRDPLRFFLALTREYGDIVQYRAMPEPAYLLNHPDYVRHVLVSNGRNYNKDTFLNKYQLEALTGQGLLTSENPLWRRQRRLIQPAFHQRSITAFAAMMVESTVSMLRRWQPLAATGANVDIAREMMRLTIEIVTQSLFGYDISRQAETIAQAMDTLITVAKPRHRLFKEQLQILDHIVYGIIETRRRQQADHNDDLLAMLLNARDEETAEGMSDRQIRDEVMSLLVAGHETTANTLSWLWYLLAQHPAVVARLQSEFDQVLGGRPPTVADLPHLVYTRMVVEEAMRLYPSAWTISRRALAADEIGGYHIPARAIVALSPYTTHRHPAYWPDPERFDPERFTPEQTAARPRFAYFPFGGGARQCIGNEFAMMESLLIVPTVLQQYQMRLVPGHIVETHVVATLRPRHGILVTLHPVGHALD